jgi:8-oxo-dGTP pyrophosphatase MutT (NUDIX family)
MPDYVVGLMRETLSDRILLIRKNRPAWQAGLLNGPGGKIEPGESPAQAMVREWQEEVGQATDPKDWRLIASLTDLRDHHAGGGTLYWFATDQRFLPRYSGPTDYSKTSDAGPEYIEPVRICEIPLRRDVIANLRWMFPLAFEDSTAPVLHSAVA